MTRICTPPLPATRPAASARGWRVWWRPVASSSLLLGSALVPLAMAAGTAQAAVGPCLLGADGKTVTCSFAYSGAAAPFTVPAGVTSLSAQVVGAAGGGGPNGTGAAGGAGALVTGALAVTPGESLQLNVGGGGHHGGGYNGGGGGGQFSTLGGGGGGASTIAAGSATLLVAGGGGGGGAGSLATPPCFPSTARGGDGGNADNPGQAGVSLSGGGATLNGGGAGGAGTATAPGAGGAGGTGAVITSCTGPYLPGNAGAAGIGSNGGNGSGVNAAGGGGGGGYYGGGQGGGAATDNPGNDSAGWGGGGGGSSYTGGAGVTDPSVNDGYNTSSDGSITLTYTAPGSSTAVSSAPNPSVYGQQVAFTATVTGTNPTGTMTFTSGSSTLCNSVALNAGGVAVCTTSALPTGSDTVTATYSGDADNASSHGATVQTVTTAATVLTAAPANVALTNLGRSVQVTGLSATLTNKTTGSPIPGQTITFIGRSGSVPLCTAVTNANGTASCAATLTGSLLANILRVDNLVIFGYTATYTPTPGYTGSSADGRVNLSAS